MRIKYMCAVLLIGLMASVAAAQEPASGQSGQERPRQEATPEQTRFLAAVRDRIRESVQQERQRENAQWEQVNGVMQNLDYLQREESHRTLTGRERARLQELQAQLQTLTRGLVGEREMRETDSAIVSQLERSYIEWRRQPSDAGWLNLTEAITRVAASKRLNSSVRITCEAPGAAVKYQTAHDRSKGMEPATAKQPTECVETLPIGYYHIWLERDSKATSNKNVAFYIAAVEETITITERQN